MQRIHWSIRFGTFWASVFTLSLFFAGWREVNTVGQASSFALLASGVVSTLLLLMVQGYWIYFEEKNKGNIKHPNKFFEATHRFIEQKFKGSKIVALFQPQLVTEVEEGNRQ